MQHPLVKGKALNGKVSVSSSNLEESIGGVIGNKIASRQAATRKQNQQIALANKAISPNIARK